MASPSAEAFDHQRPLLLIVDDEPHMLEFLQMGFSYEGFSVSTATTGAAALRLAEAQQPDLVILDVMMPGLNGLEVARRLRRASDAAIIMLTARGDVDDRVTGLEAGADDYVPKPFAFKELLARVRAVLRRQGKNLDRLLTFQDVTLDRDTRLWQSYARCAVASVPGCPSAGDWRWSRLGSSPCSWPPWG